MELERRSQRRELARRALRATSSASSATRPRPSCALVPRRFEVSFGTERSAPELQRGLELGDGLTLSREDRPDRRRPVQRARDRPGLQVGQGLAHSARADRATSCGSRSRSTCSCCATSSGSSRSAASTARSRATRGARGMLRAEARDDLPGFVPQRLPRRGRVLGAGRGRARARARRCAERIRRGDVAPRPEGRRVPGVVRPLADVPGGARVMATTNPEQLAAVEARGEVFVSAGAGTGKTAVLVERFVRAVCDEGLDVESVLVITYTSRPPASCARASARRCASAAATTSRASSTAPGSRPSTASAPGSCGRTRSRSGIDPRFRELDEAQGAVLRGEAFDARARGVLRRRASPTGCGCSRPTARARLRRMLTGVYETLRSAGRPLVLELGERPDLDERARGAARGGAVPRRRRRTRPTPQRANAARGARVLAASRRRAAARPRAALRARGARAATYEEARKRVEQAALDARRGARPRPAPGAARRGSPPQYAAGEGARVGARLRGPPARSRATCSRDDARDPRARAAALPRDHGRRVPGHEPPPVRADRPARRRAGRKEVFFVGDEFQSIYGFRHADVGVFRERRARGGAAGCR